MIIVSKTESKLGEDLRRCIMDGSRFNCFCTLKVSAVFRNVLKLGVVCDIEKLEGICPLECSQTNSSSNNRNRPSCSTSIGITSLSTMSSSSRLSPTITSVSSGPELSLPRVRIPTISREMNQPPAVVTPTEAYVPQDELNRCGKEERSGRWSEDEHKVFLDGLEKHGKQWKTIAAMIGTRTVVQVRTHAQKYFHKLERSRQKSSPRVAATRSVPQAKKRKSVAQPPAPLHTKKSKRVQEKLSKIKEATAALLPPPVLVQNVVET